MSLDAAEEALRSAWEQCGEPLEVIDHIRDQSVANLAILAAVREVLAALREAES